MIIKNIYFILGLLLIFLFASYQIYIKTEDINIQEEQEIIINDVFINNHPNLDYLGYLEIPNYGVKRLIKKGTDKSTLDEGYIGLLENSKIEEGNTVLAGHNIDKVFKVLHKIKNKEQVIITTNEEKYVYYVIQKREIDVDDLSYFEDTNEKLLTLITCTDDKNKRLIIRLKLLK